MQTLTRRYALLWVVLLLLADPLPLRAASVSVAWDYPGNPAPATFRLYRRSGPCPLSGPLPQSLHQVVSVDSEETNTGNFRIANAFDNTPATLWHTEFLRQVVPLPHTLILDLGTPYQVDGLRYLPRQDGIPNGTIARYQVEMSLDTVAWQVGSSGTFPNTTTEQRLLWPPRTARYIKLTALSEIGGRPYTSAAELQLIGAPLLPPGATLVGAVAGTVRSYTDTTVPATGTHCWTLTSVSAQGQESSPSNSVQVPPPAPSNFRMTLP